jgi:small subunit ribosomal protein S21
MSGTRVGKDETIESALRRFKKDCARSGVLSEVKKREHFEKPSVKKKLKSEAARKKLKKKSFR